MRLCKTLVVCLVLFCFSAMIVSASDYGLTSVSGVWTGTSGGSGITGVNTNEVRWGTPASQGGSKSGLRFDGTGVQAFNEGDTFLLGQLTHFNWPVNSNTAADGATLKIKMIFSSPAVSPDPEFTYDFAVEETPNSQGNCPAWQVSSTPCDDRITFPSSFGEESYQIGDKLYTLKILGFVNAYPSGSPVSSFITEEQKDNTAYLVGTLSSVLVAAPQITLVSKTVNGHLEETSPGLTLYVGDPITWEYLVQNTGNVALTDITVTDDQGVVVTCPQTTLAAGDSMTCTGSGTATLGQYENTATASGKHNGNIYTTSEAKASYYVGVNPGPTCVDGYGNVCQGPANDCSQSTPGTIQCDGSCNVTEAPANPENYGNPCESNANNCGLKGQGTIQCDSSCNAVTPADPAGYGDACYSPENACGGKTQGTIQCDSSCNAVTPVNPQNYGKDCTSPANSCGQTAKGTFQCDGSCSATIPSETGCGGGNPGVPEFPLFTLGLAVIGVGLGLALLRKKE